jgi:hypothetical protein
MHALMLAVRNHLRTTLKLKDAECDLTPPNGQPPPLCGQHYYAVHEGKIDPPTSYSDFDEVYSVSVTVTVRLRGSPWDRTAQNVLYGDDKSLDRRARAVAAAVHQDTIDNRIINAANALPELLPPAEGYSVQGFYEPLRYQGMDTAHLVGPDWFSADPGKAGAPDCGYRKTVRFTGARRTQESGFAN